MNQKNKKIFIATVRILYVSIIIFLLYCLFNLPHCMSPLTALAATNAKNSAYLDQMQSISVAYFNQKNVYIGLDKNSDYIILTEKIAKNINNANGCASDSCSFPWFNRSFCHSENLFSQQIKEEYFCAKVNLIGKDDDRYWCIDNYGYSGTTAKEYCTAEKPYCDVPLSLPQGYTLNNYSIEKKLEIACQKNSDCVTPAEYAIQSRCPFVSLCLENKCAVVCPAYQN